MSKSIMHALEHSVFSSYRSSSNSRGLVFNLSEKLVGIMIMWPCYYCGAKHSNAKIVYGKTQHRTLRYNGIDRIDNDRGYEIDNVVTCCSYCNRAKMDMGKEDFLALCRRVAKKHPLKPDTQFTLLARAEQDYFSEMLDTQNKRNYGPH